MATHDDLQLLEFSAPEDHARARDLIERAAQADGQKSISDQALLEVAQGSRKLYGFVKDDLVAVGVLGAGEMDLLVDPAARQQGIGDVAFMRMLDLAGDQPLKVWVHGNRPAANTLLARNGFKEIRHLLLMTCPPDRVQNTTMRLPEGFHCENFDASSAEHRSEVLAVNTAAFASHPEQGALNESDFDQLLEEPWFDSADFLLCRFGEQLAGFGWVKTTPFIGNPNRKETELYVMAVHPDFAGKGLGSTILDGVFERMAEHDPARVTLYVEGDNTAALRIYKRAGFSETASSYQWGRGPATSDA